MWVPRRLKAEAPGQVDWPEGAKSAVVIAIKHPENTQELDCVDALGGDSTAGNTPGNKLLIAAANKLADWIEQELGMTSYRTPYHIWAAAPVHGGNVRTGRIGLHRQEQSSGPCIPQFGATPGGRSH